MLRFYTSKYQYQGPSRLDVTVKGQDSLGKHFAPTWEMLGAWKSGAISSREYTARYYELMRERYRNDRGPWDELLNKDEAVLVCFEAPEDGFCHRYVLANILERLGAMYCGELNEDGSFWGRVDLAKFHDPNGIENQ